jgi:hypothetical protein
MERIIDGLIRALGHPVTILLFVLIPFLSLPQAVASASVLTLVSWFAQTFVQLVALAVIQSGQNRQGARMERLLQETHDATIEELADMRAEQSERHRKLAARLFGGHHG